MGCLNSKGQFNHWFGNIHLSGPCNRSCYFCIGQHMMVLDPLNNLDKWPLDNIDVFVKQCLEHNISEINITGSNTDPLLYKRMPQLRAYLESYIPNLCLGIRTNGALKGYDNWGCFDKGSISVTSLNKDIYKTTMGCGSPPNIERILKINHGKEFKINVVLCPETVNSGDVYDTVEKLVAMGIEKINLREPYGQPHIGNPLHGLPEVEPVHGMPTYKIGSSKITYWDVHYVEVESVNLYANGEVSTTYPVTEGHCPKTGKVMGQENFIKSGRIVEQWKKGKK